MNRSFLLAALGFVLGVLSLSLNVGQEIPVAVGGARGPLMMSNLGPSDPASALPAEEVADARRDFYFRRIEGSSSAVAIPLRPRGPFGLAVRMDSTVRTKVDVLDGNTRLGGSFVGTGPWNEVVLEENLRLNRVAFTLTFEDAPLVRRSDLENFRRYVDQIVIRSHEGFDLPWPSRIAGGLVVLFLVAIARFTSVRMAPILIAVALPAIFLALFLREPVALSLALPRLLGFVLLSATLISVLGRILDLSRSMATILALLGSAMVLACGFLSFLPNHAPADLDIHIWRTVDLAGVPMSYDGWLRYGSHYPTPSQVRGAATEALGEGPLIPYSPLPYVLFHAAQLFGLDLHWAMNAVEATSLALLLPLVFAFASAASSEAGGLIAAALMALDLATIHHLGRAHSPAVVGGALGLAGLLALGIALPRIQEPGGWRVPALLLGLCALGYSSTPLFYGLFGIALMALASAQGKTRGFVRPIALSLAAGGIIALVLFYGHYIPGLIRAGNSGLISDPFPGRTFFIFHNESRQSLRLWRLGLFVPFLAAIPALYFILTRCSAIVRSFLLAWLCAWMGIMWLKEPWALPRLLRWAKEDFYVAPSLALILAIAIGRIESRPLRITLTALTLVVAAILRARDYGFHADTLRFLK